MKERNKKIIIFSFILGITISLLCFLIGYYSFLFPKLNNFKLNSFKKENDAYILKFDENRNAIKYQVVITDNEDNELYDNTFDTNEIRFTDLYLEHDTDVFITVYAIDKNDVKKQSENTIEHTWEELSFKDNVSYYANQDEDFVIEINGLEHNDNHQISIYNESEFVGAYDITKEKISIPYKDIKSYSGRLIAYVTKNDIAYDKMNFYINTTLVGNIEILEPAVETSYDWQDIDFIYSGGTNATEIYLNVRNAKTNKVHKKITLDKEESLLDAYSFEEETEYILELRAVYKDYEEIARSDSIKVYIGKIPEMQPVYIDYNPTNIKKGTVIELKTRSKDGIIKYTTDGSKPNKNSATYIEPFTINENMTIKAYTYKEKTIVSEINTYEFTIGNKLPTIYLSPSNQTWNHGATGSGFTTEYQMMNKVADVVQKELKNAGLKVYRNNPNQDIMTYVQQSRNLGADLHFAIHSNGSPEHNVNGMEIWVHDQTSNALSIANKMYNNLYSIYPYQSDKADRGVKFAEGALGEVNTANVKTGILIEIAFHDNMNDAKWITENIETIGKNLANSILEYYQVK